MIRLFSMLMVCASMLLSGCSKNGGDDGPKTYTITVVSEGNGTVGVDKATAAEGATVKLEATPASGYGFKRWNCESVTFLPNATTADAAFTMPAKNVIVSAEFVAEYVVSVTSDGNGEASADKQSAREGETVKLTATPAPDYSFVKWKVESGGVTCSPDASANPATFIMSAGNVSIKAIFINGARINGVVWAHTNVDAPGTFAANPEDTGMFYQWNRKVGWSSTDPMVNSNGGTTWNSTGATGDVWATANDPCPAGWRVPIIDEFAALCDAEKTTIGDWIILNDVKGRWFTDNESNNSIFLPAAGYRKSTGELYNINLQGFYWSANPSTDSRCRSMYLDKTGVTYTSTTNSPNGFVVRCVSK